MKQLLVALGTLIVSFSSVTAFADEARLERGKELFISSAQPIPCAICHTLNDAGTTGTIGPNFDELKPDAERIRRTMLEGMGAMPSFEDMDEDDREAVIEYLVSATQ
ncbi:MULTISPECIES: c-type cytochrome [Oligella]|uniref:Sulfide dehydrogenase n=2 Tax=Oligella urethralis TaxID=90245 RepID=A0A096BE33_9BURK|nr:MULTISPECIES: cytochrome c [Oligella]AVL70163.1 cytochrome c [Oligella urethralis]KGF31419.1 sulfide dehydrogenase [Oligella urethralis DNF00040]MDK6202397.1 cytochrome c [Oligella urethralis]OFS85918.1 sulfide dehydrogenase [Oligella sp. HMSC05A10]OFV45998.1 sulfide dehydrogenase [Oligella sp. HMSC09E12]